MKLGIDLRALQTGHKYRGIGEVAKQLTNRIVEIAQRDNVEFVFYEYEDDDPKLLLDLPKDLTYEVYKIGPMPEGNVVTTKSEKLKRHLAQLFGNPIPGSDIVDVYLQYDYAFGVPKNTKTIVTVHDFIPFVFWSSYFESAWVPFKNKALRTTLRTLFANYRSKRLAARGMRNARRLVAISENTKQDIIKFFGIKPKKIDVVHLGVDIKPVKTDSTTTGSHALPTKPYLLFIGAGDARRRVDDLVAAYNNLKARGYDIQLVLVGENFQSKEAIPTLNVRNAVLHSSYGDDILTLGYVSDEEKQRLYSGALAYAYPTLYEGFGLPVLESMIFGSPIISYDNSSIKEIGGKFAKYANDWEGIVDATEELLAMSAKERKDWIDSAKKHAQKFTWDKTAQKLYDTIQKTGN